MLFELVNASEEAVNRDPLESLKIFYFFQIRLEARNTFAANFAAFAPAPGK